jgi:hypothetical protein
VECEKHYGVSRFYKPYIICKLFEVITTAISGIEHNLADLGFLGRKFAFQFTEPACLTYFGVLTFPSTFVDDVFWLG